MSLTVYTKIVTVLIFLGILTTYPYVFDRFLPIPSMQVVAVGILGILLVLLPTRKIKPLPTIFTICIVIQMGVWFLYSLIHNDTSYYTRIFFLLLTYVSILSLNSSLGIEEFIKKNNCLIAIQAILGLFAFVLVFVGILSPIFSFENVDNRVAHCFGLTCSNAVYGNIIRAAGFFDEPGALAGWGIYALVFNALYIKNSKIEKLLIFGLVSTLSMAYFIQLALYLVCFKMNLKKKNFLIFLVLSLFVYGVYTLGDGNKLYDMTFGRFEVDKYGHGETAREVLMEEAKKHYEMSPIIGNGATKIEEIGYMGDNPYELLAKDGIIGTIITYLPLFILLCIGRKNKYMLFAILIVFVGYLQRPFHMNFLHYIMLFSFLLLGLKYKYYDKSQSYNNNYLL